MQKQRLIMGCFSFLILVLVIVWSGMITIAHADALEGKTFVGELGEKGKNKGDKDELIFKDGKFRSTACDAYGFGDAPYTATVEGDSTTFEAETFSEKEGKMKWTGTIKGDVLEGSATWYPLGNKDPKEYWVRAQLKK